MKNQTSKFIVAAFAAAVGTVASVNAQTYGVDISTTTTPTSDTLAPRLFLSPGNPTPTTGIFGPPTSGARLWFVADTDHNGIPAAPGGVPVAPGSQFSPSGILGGGDTLLFGDFVTDGDAFGENPGLFTQLGLTVANEFQDDTIYAIVWNRITAPGASFAPQEGDTFGIFNIGVQAPAGGGLGNANWRISNDVFANTYSVVPEPQSAIYAGLGLAMLAFLRRRLQRA